MFKKLLERLTQPATEKDPEQLIALAAATLLLEVSWADQDISEVELTVIQRALQSQFQLDHDTALALIEQARREHAQSVGSHAYARVINESWNEAEKFELLVALWRLALADRTLDRYEEHTIRSLAELLYMSHERFIEAKQQARRGD